MNEKEPLQTGGNPKISRTLTLENVLLVFSLLAFGMAIVAQLRV